MKRWMLALGIVVASASLRAEGVLLDQPLSPRSQPTSTSRDADIAEAPAQPRTIRAVGTVTRNVQAVVNGKVVTKSVVQVVYNDVTIPTSDEEISSLRNELKLLNQKRIDELTPESLVSELAGARMKARQQEGWKKLQELRNQLEEVATTYSGTPAGGAAAAALGQIPAGDEPTPVPTPANLIPSNPFTPLPLDRAEPLGPTR